ncbi:hypothetical protein LNQ03_04820 [Klebsiella pneumoniae subsp. pneumoniae]|nr:hypothetical protein [Klebsiella pneumoniae subsp. pneumoniae]
MQQAVPESRCWKRPPPAKGRPAPAAPHCPWMAWASNSCMLAERSRAGGAEHEIHVDEALQNRRINSP